MTEKIEKVLEKYLKKTKNDFQILSSVFMDEKHKGCILVFTQSPFDESKF